MELAGGCVREVVVHKLGGDVGEQVVYRLEGLEVLLALGAEEQVHGELVADVVRQVGVVLGAAPERAPRAYEPSDLAEDGRLGLEQAVGLVDYDDVGHGVGRACLDGVPSLTEVEFGVEALGGLVEPGEVEHHVAGWHGDGLALEFEVGELLLDEGEGGEGYAA